MCELHCVMWEAVAVAAARQGPIRGSDGWLQEAAVRPSGAGAPQWHYTGAPALQWGPGTKLGPRVVTL